MQIEEMERLVLLLRDSQVRELTLKQGTSRVTIRKPAPVLVQEDVHESDWQTETEIVSEGETEFKSNIDTPTRVPITAALVGFFHHVKPMVGIGAELKVGTKVGVIEAMKLVSDIKSPIAGVVVDLLIEDGMPVEYGQPLYILQPFD